MGEGIDITQISCMTFQGVGRRVLIHVRVKMSSSCLASVASIAGHVYMEAMEALLKAIDCALDIDHVVDAENVESPCNILGPRHQLHNCMFWFFSLKSCC